MGGVALAVLQGIETLARYFDRPILTNNPLLSDSDRSEYKLRFAGVNMLGMCQYLLSARMT